MRYPKMQRQPRTAVSVPQLNGGLNLYDLPEHVNDNQLTDCNNVWWHNGALQTRPGMNRIRELKGFGGTVKCQAINEQEALFMRFVGQGAGKWLFYAACVSTYNVLYIGGEEDSYYISSDDGVPSVIGTRAPKGADYEWCFYMSTGNVVTWGSDGGWKTANQNWYGARGFVPYVPCGWYNGRGDDAPGGSDAVTLEAPNLLTNHVRCTFTTDGVSKAYTLPYDDAGLVSARLTIGSKGDDGVVSVRTYETGEPDSSYNLAVFEGLTAKDLGVKDSTSQVRIQLKGNQLIFWGEKSIDGITLPEAYTESANNLEVIVACNSKGYDEHTIPKMNTAIWYGGDRSSHDGGIHLFVAGNEDKPNMLCWSDINDPLYFPENNYAYVGEDSAAITALAKQGELLVIFRERDIYCVQYVAGDVPTAEEMETGAATETTVHKAYFPLTQLHPNIGCDCPNTVRLVNNKLVWLTSDGTVYILTGSNQYSERNVRKASTLIERELKKHSKEELQAAMAGEMDGYYVILVGNKMYLLDCQTSAFNSFQYYSREETAQKALPWYIWTLPEHNYAGIIYDGLGVVIVANDLGDAAAYEFCYATDDGESVQSFFVTKQFDFARPDQKKSIDQIYLSVSDVQGCRLQLGYVTDRYTADDAYTLECDGAANGSIRTFRITPNVRMVQRFGLRVSAREPLMVSGVSIKYKYQGVVR